MKHVHGGDVYHHAGCLDFSANCNPLGTPQGVRQAVTDSLDELVNYPQVGYEELKMAIADYEWSCGTDLYPDPGSETEKCAGIRAYFRRI